MPDTIFYSWQSDLPNKTNRSLIEQALDRAVAALGKSAFVDPALRRDSDTKGVPGSPDIAATILRKIETAAIFLCDVSIVSPPTSSRATPNPNVLFELGYALKALGPSRIVMVMNVSFGGPELLPFDLRFKRVLKYSAIPGGASGQQKAPLEKQILDAIRSIVTDSIESERSRRLSAAASEVIGELVEFLLFAEQMGERALNPWFEQSQSNFEWAASRFRDLAATPQAQELKIAAELVSLATRIRGMVNHERSLGAGNWLEYLEVTATAVGLASGLLRQLLARAAIGDDSKSQALDRVRAAAHRLRALATDSASALESADFDLWEEIRDKGAEEGKALLELSYYELGCKPACAARFRALATRLHQLELVEQTTLNTDEIERCLRTLQGIVEELLPIIEDTPIH